MNISSEQENTTDWDQLIFVIKGSIEAKQLKEKLAQAKVNFSF